MHLIRCAFIGAASLAISTQAMAAEWVLVATSSDGDQHYIDTSSMQRDGTLITVWEKITVDPIRSKTAKNETSFKDHYTYDCANHRSKLLSGIVYWKDGTNSTLAGDGSWNDIAPETVADGVLQQACAK